MCFIWHDMQWTKEGPGPVSLGPSSAFTDRPPWNYRLRMRPLLRCGFWLFFLSFLLSFFLSSFFPSFIWATTTTTSCRRPSLGQRPTHVWQIWLIVSRSEQIIEVNGSSETFHSAQSWSFSKGSRYGRSGDTFLAVPLFPSVCVWRVVLAWAADFAPREIIKQRWNRKLNE